MADIVKKTKKDKRTCWSEPDESFLVELWAEKFLELRGPRKNNHVYKEMAESFSARPKQYTADEIKVKLHNLTNKYRKEQKAVGPSGGSPSDWHLYPQVHAILGGLRINNLDSFLEDSITKESMTPSTPSQNCENNSFNSSPDEAGESAPKAAKRRRIESRLEQSDKILKEHLEAFRESDERMIHIEEQRNQLLERFIISSENISQDIRDFLRNNNYV